MKTSTRKYYLSKGAVLNCS